MKRVILIEDRPTRQEKFTKHLDQNLNEIVLLKNICGGVKFDEYKEKISSNNLSDFMEYDVIMIHRSALNQAERLYLIEFIKSQSKTVVFFSGGISSISLQEIGKGNILTINSKDFYSISLINYLFSEPLNILELAFGSQWAVNLQVSLLDKLAFYLANYSPKPLTIIFSELKITNWAKDNYFDKINSGVVQTIQLKEIMLRVQKDLLKSI